nr:venom peptide [Acharia stimulea]
MSKLLLLLLVFALLAQLSVVAADCIKRGKSCSSGSRCCPGTVCSDSKCKTAFIPMRG